MRMKIATEVGIAPIAERVAVRLGSRQSYLLIELRLSEARELRDNLSAAIETLEADGAVAPDFDSFMRTLSAA